MPTGQRFVLGVYDHPHDDEVPFIRSRDVGDGFAADWAQKLTGATNTVEKALDRLLPG